jgi:hypothetical protein
MQINSNIRELLLEPMLKGQLLVEVDEFVLETADGPVELAATMRCDEGDRIRVDIRDREGRDLSGFFPKKTEFTKEDTLAAKGTIGGKVRIRIEGIWPPSNWSHPIVGVVATTTARLSAGLIRIPSAGLDELPSAFIKQYVEHLHSGGGIDFTCEIPETEEQEYEHLAVFSGTKLKFRNTSRVWSENHSFWGEYSGWKTVSWDGQACDGTFSLMQDGDDLKVGFKHKATNVDEAKSRAEALFFAIGYTHAINPWSNYLQVREGGRIIDEQMRPIRLEQGAFVPLWERHGHGSDAPTKLIAAVAKWFIDLPEKARKDLVHAYWVFRSADHDRTPPPAQMAMIGAVIEGLFDTSKTSKEPESLVKLREDAIEWLKKVESEGGETERSGFARQLAGYIEDWNPQSRRVAWMDTFRPLFPGRDEWLDKVFSIYKKHRNPPAHGDFVSATKVPLETLQARGLLAGFVNLVIAAKAGYEGPILESPFADNLLELKLGSSSKTESDS